MMMIYLGACPVKQAFIQTNHFSSTNDNKKRKELLQFSVAEVDYI